MRYPSISPFTTLACLSQIWACLVQAGCYHPNGTQTRDAYHAPCSKDTSNPLSTICCAIERPAPFGWSRDSTPSNDRCLDNGICMWMNNGTDYTSYWREECTFTDWKSGKCLNLCLDHITEGNQQMTPCDGTPTSEKWCCGPSTACCDVAPSIVPAMFKHTEPLSSVSPSSSPSPASTKTSANTPQISSATLSSGTHAPTASTHTTSSNLASGSIGGIAIGACAFRHQDTLCIRS
ncbi:hypothetical protein CC86DRAFT_388436 [Ophiobolus disseminans]|uniref:Uncharacterized protein n=1 Tax=Ophiobolus disseminans TaxID=1469910 RepID=A0A6A6ZFN6_9PLEO|nr:hypothetical protein CC86DRAFT_388436 [Ophiobolus disseminans]